MQAGGECDKRFHADGSTKRQRGVIGEVADSVIGVNGAREQRSGQDCSEAWDQTSSIIGAGSVFSIGTRWADIGEESAKGSCV